MDIKNVAVIGGGTMGNGIAHVFASKGYSVTLIDQEEDILQRASKLYHQILTGN
jgi:3-hydroxybutyryl-CoA dehydrogenase